MNIKDFLDNLAKELQSKAGITVEIVDDHNFPGGFYMNFSEFSTAVLRVNQYGKFSMRGVNFENDVFSYPWKYKYLILTDNAVNALAKTFPQVEFDSTKEAALLVKVMAKISQGRGGLTENPLIGGSAVLPFRKSSAAAISSDEAKQGAALW